MKRTGIFGVLLVGMLASLSAVAPAGAADHGSAAAPIVFTSNRASGIRELYVVNADGSGEHRLTFNHLNARDPEWSPDGARIVFSGIDNGNWDIYSVDASGGDLRRLTTGPETDLFPRWTAAGGIVWQRGIFSCPCTAWIMDAGGTGQARIPLPGNVLTLDPSPQGRRLAYATDAGGSWSLHVATLDGAGDRQITTGPAAFGDFTPRWSPTGEVLSFLRDDTGNNNDIYTVRASGQDLQHVLSTPNDNEFWQTWSSDARSLLYQSQNDGHLHSVSLRDGSVSDVPTTPTAPFTETFDGGVRDDSMWHEISDQGSTIGTSAGRLVASIAGTAVPGGQYNQVDAHWGSQCRLAGDFDYQVDYSLLTWPAHNGYFAALNSFFADGAVARTSSQWDPPYDEQYSAWANTVPFSFNGVHTNDLGGSMRLVRHSGTLDAYVRSPGGDWQLILSTPGVTGEGIYGMGLSVQAQNFAHLDGSVAYDNFRLNSGALSCPSWWQDYQLDVAHGVN
jgi:hypothetical protein